MRKKISILIFLTLVTATFVLAPSTVSANSVGSSTMYFEGTLTDNGDGTYSGVLPMVDEAAAGIGDNTAGYDIFGENGEDAWFGDDPGSGPVWTNQNIVNHDAWPTWNPDTPDWYQYSLNLYKDGNDYKWALRNHPGATAANPWYDTAHWGSELTPKGVPMSGEMNWYTMYALETDLGAYLPGTGTPEIPNGAAGYGGGAGAWDMDWSWGSEVVPLQRPGFNVFVNDLGGGQYRVRMVPANEPAYHLGQNRLDSATPLSVNTDVTVISGTGTGSDPPGSDPPPSGAIEPFIKHKWELVEELDETQSLDNQIDDDPNHDFLAVGLNPYGTRTVHYYVIVEEKTYNLDRCYVDVWHPDGNFKYQVSLSLLDLQNGIDAWDHVTTNYPEVITSQTLETYPETLDELQQEEAFVYHGWAELSYCQPAGWYTVVARATDSHGMWSIPVWNWFWYIPTASIDLDFTSVGYGTVGELEWKWAGGDTIFDPAEIESKPTIRNTGNVPLRLRFKQDDMNFNKTLENGVLNWNVQFDARLGNAVDGDQVTYWPDTWSGWVNTLEMCTEDKLDFSIHIYKGVPGTTYNGNLWIEAQTYKGDYSNGPYPISPYAPDVGQLWYNGIAPDGVPDPQTEGPGFEPTV